MARSCRHSLHSSFAPALLPLVLLVLAPHRASVVRAGGFKAPAPAAPAATAPAVQQSAISAVFSFGDSLTDGGNTKFFGPDEDMDAACSKPYGQTALGGSCRWSDGKVMVDFIVDRLGLPPAVPSDDIPKAKAAAAAGTSINFAVGGTGVTFEKQQNQGEMVDLDSQVDDFLKLAIKPDTIGKSLIFITAGGNDFRTFSTAENNRDTLLLVLSNPISRFVTSLQAKDQAFVTGLVNGTVNAVKRLYAAGARRFLIPSVPALGCNPAIATLSAQLTDDRVCLTYANRMSTAHATQLKAALLALGLDGATFMVPNLVDTTKAMWEKPSTFGLTKSVWSCCHGAKEAIPCGKTILSIPAYSVCSDASKTMFWDGFHFTHATAAMLAERMWSGDSNFLSPTNLKTLVGAK